MSRSYELLPIGDNAPEEVNAVIEIPRGSSNKYEYDREHGIFRLDRPLYSPLFYPFVVNLGLSLELKRKLELRASVSSAHQY